MHQRNNICLPQRDLARNSRLATLAYFKHDSDHKFKPTEFRLFETAKTLVFRICYNLPMLIYCHTKAVYHTGCLQGCQYVTQTWNQLQNKSSWCQTINMNNKPPLRFVFWYFSDVYFTHCFLRHPLRYAMFESWRMQFLEM